VATASGRFRSCSAKSRSLTITFPVGYRYPPQPRVDGLHGEEGTFNMCSFWLVEAVTRAGPADPAMLDQARLLFERMLDYANHLDLYSEQTSSQGEALCNFPQAFTHPALISASVNLDRALSRRDFNRATGLELGLMAGVRPCRFR
jgi:GH15 family glucan-1,4-alpha-glucosidase